MTEKDKSTLLLEYYLKKLKLPTMLREYAGAAAVCGKIDLISLSISCACARGRSWIGRNALPKDVLKSQLPVM